MDQSHAWLVVNARSGSNSEAAREHLEDALSRHDCAVAETIEFPDRTLPTREELDGNQAAPQGRMMPASSCQKDPAVWMITRRPVLKKKTTARRQ